MYSIFSSSLTHSYHTIPKKTFYFTQLKYTALELSDTRGTVVLFSAAGVAEAEAILGRLLEHDLPSSMFYRVLGSNFLTAIRGVGGAYARVMASFVQSLQTLWTEGKLSNFEYLIHLNAAAGRSFLDLTQVRRTLFYFLSLQILL